MYSLLLLAFIVTINLDPGQALLKHVFVTFRAPYHTPCDYGKGPQITGIQEKDSVLTTRGRLDAYKIGKAMFFRYSSKFDIRNTNKDLLFWSIGPKRIQEAILLAKIGWHRQNDKQNRTFYEDELRAVKFPDTHQYTKFYDQIQCPAYFAELGKLNSTFKELLQKYDTTLKAIKDQLNDKIDIENPVEVWLAYETFQMQEANEMKPEWLTSDMMKDLKQFSIEFLLTATSTNKLRHLAGGSIVYDIMHDIDEIKDGKKCTKSLPNTDPKISILAVPQIVMAAQVVGFLPQDASYGSKFTIEDFYPDMGAVHIVELHVIADTAWKIKVMYKNKEGANWKVLKLPGCSETCPVEKAQKLLKDLILYSENLVKECTTTVE